MRMKRILLLTILFLLPLPLLALDAPQLTGRVNDYARMLSAEGASRLTRNWRHSNATSRLRSSY